MNLAIIMTILTLLGPFEKGRLKKIKLEDLYASELKGCKQLDHSFRQELINNDEINGWNVHESHNIHGGNKKARRNLINRFERNHTFYEFTVDSLNFILIRATWEDEYLKNNFEKLELCFFNENDFSSTPILHAKKERSFSITEFNESAEVIFRQDTIEVKSWRSRYSDIIIDDKITYYSDTTISKLKIVSNTQLVAFSNSISKHTWEE
ncbi:hypothetical protein [Reichenbachiella sp.]|uniref:hypothetical protein n=1 Tax=Reichenbachiella sp. TaxID=2184521 RepID=UPI003BAEF493